MINYMSDITWDDVEAAMSTFVPTSGGYSIAKRGIVTLANGLRVFVKLATNQQTTEFINEEIKSYQWLRTKGYKHVPELLLSRPGEIVLPDLSQLDWSENWTEKKLQRILAAMDELSALEITKKDRNILKYVEIGNGWQELKDDPAKKDKLVQKLKAYPKLVEALNKRLDDFMRICNEYYNARDQFVLIHADVRADNFAYDEKNEKVWLADWNWMGLGRKGFDDVGLLVSVARSGFDVDSFCPERIDKMAALCLAGFWLSRCMNKIWEGGDPGLRDFQFESGLQAAKWAEIA